MSVSVNDVKRAAQACGVEQGDILLVHSSFKSLGPVDGGAETVISGFLEALGEEGTLVLPTFCQKEFEHAYETWHLDKHSDVGYLTNYFRKREGSVRSDQATHSVAACGKKAQWLTRTHGHTHKRFGNMGDTPFSADSPWEKMYQENAKILLLGVTPMSITFRHYAEYLYIEECLKNLEGHPEYAQMKSELHSYDKFGKLDPWPHVYNVWVYEQMEKLGMTRSARCGNATFLCVEAKPFVDFVLEQLKKKEDRILWRIENAWDTDEWIAWRNRYEENIH